MLAHKKASRNGQHSAPRKVQPDGGNASDEDSESSGPVAQQHVGKKRRRPVVVCDAEDDIDDIDSDANGTFDNSNDDPPLPKAAKINDWDGRPRKKDFDGYTQVVIKAATSHFRCLIVTEEAFPKDAQMGQFALVSWAAACEALDFHYSASPAILKLVRRLLSARDLAYSSASYLILDIGARITGPR